MQNGYALWNEVGEYVKSAQDKKAMAFAIGRHSEAVETAGRPLLPLAVYEIALHYTAVAERSAINLSTCFARMSHSMFTRAPGL